MKKLSVVKASLTKEQLKKLKSGGTITLKKGQVGNDGKDELQLSSLKHKKMTKNHSRDKGFKLSLNGDEELNGQGVQAVGNVPLQTLKIPSSKILSTGGSYGGKVQAGIEKSDAATYNTFIKYGHPATNPVVGPLFDQSYHFRYPVTREGKAVLMGGCGNCGGGVGSPFNPIKINTQLDQSH